MTDTTDPVYEMFWDCPYCGQDKLLGLTHRHCPGCGSPQDPGRRYFPEEAEKVAVAEHRFVGADLVCSNCGAPSAATAHNCGRCGGQLGDDDQEVALKVAAPPPVPAAAPRSRTKLFVVLAVVIACLIGGVVAFTWKSEQGAEIAGHSWYRSIAIERYQSVDRSSWCDGLPADAQVLSRQSRQRGTRRIPDGETCSTRNVDNGDGTFRQVQECRPRYREEPVYEQYCSYRVNRWVQHREAVARGTGTSPAPHWPAANVDGCRRLGCTRTGARSERYEVALRLSEGGSASCDLPARRWAEIADGSRWLVPVGVLTGRPDCARLQPAP